MLSTRDPGPPDGMNPADYWAQLLFDGEEAVTDEQRAKFDAWLAESDANELDYRRAVAVQVMAPEAAPAGQVEHFSPRAENHSEQERIAGRRNIFKYAAAAAFVGLVGGGVYLERKNLFGETHSTRTGETRTAQFSDGSVAYLNTRTQVRWLGKGAERRVELVTGEALFDVVHDETHPFSVMLEGSEIRVLGTRFNVYRKDSGDVVVTVLEGVVEVRGFAQGGGARPEWVRRVRANEQMEYRHIGLIDEPHRTDPQLAVKWRSGILQLPEDGALLPEVLGELTRYTDERILIRDPRLAAVKVGGVFSTRNVRNALQKLQTVAPIEVRESDGLFTLDYRVAARERN